MIGQSAGYRKCTNNEKMDLDWKPFYSRLYGVLNNTQPSGTQNLAGFGHNFEKMVSIFLQISSLKLILQKTFNTYELILIKFYTKHLQ